MPELEREVSELKIEGKELGISEAEKLSINEKIINLREVITAPTLKDMEIRKASAGNQQGDHLRLTNCTIFKYSFLPFFSLRIRIVYHRCCAQLSLTCR